MQKLAPTNSFKVCPYADDALEIIDHYHTCVCRKFTPINDSGLSFMFIMLLKCYAHLYLHREHVCSDVDQSLTRYLIHDGRTSPTTSLICTVPPTALSSGFIKAIHNLSMEHRPIIVVLWRDTNNCGAGHKKYVCLLQAVESSRNQCLRRILFFSCQGI